MSAQGLVDRLKEVVDAQLDESYELGKKHQKDETIGVIQYMARQTNNAAIISFVGDARDELLK